MISSWFVTDFVSNSRGVYIFGYSVESQPSPSYRRTRRQRKQVEILFAHMKRVLKMDRLRLRGLSGAQDEFLLTATAQNLRRMAKYRGTDPPGVPEMA
jgi:hypothetical protein